MPEVAFIEQLLYERPWVADNVLTKNLGSQRFQKLPDASVTYCCIKNQPNVIAWNGNNYLLFHRILDSGLDSGGQVFSPMGCLLGLEHPWDLFHSHFQHLCWNGWNSWEPARQTFLLFSMWSLLPSRQPSLSDGLGFQEWAFQEKKQKSRNISESSISITIGQKEKKKPHARAQSQF